MPCVKVVTSCDIWLKRTSLNSSSCILDSNSERPVWSLFIELLRSAILFTRNDSSIDCVHVGHVTLSLKKLYSLPAALDFCLILPLKSDRVRKDFVTSVRFKSLLSRVSSSLESSSFLSICPLASFAIFPSFSFLPSSSKLSYSE